METIFTYLLPKERIMKITYKDFLFKWEVDIIENPEAHFKAEDLRKSGVYDYHYQSIDKMEKDPWHQEIPKELHNEIKTFIQNNFTKKDREKSLDLESTQAYYYWKPINE